MAAAAAAQTHRGVPLSTLCPKFLHTNSTSHTGPFSAIAELIDNAYDPDVNAGQIWVDKTVVKGEECLSFMDNGNGLNHETMHKMLSFGYSDKTTVNRHAPIGIYGNGFKSGSMRLGKDAIVFSKSRSISCVGMLSQTYLKEINANQIIVPIICFEHTNGSKFSVKEEHKSSLQDILQHSPFKTQEELVDELNIISSSWSRGKTGTRIIIWNLRRTSTGTLEFDFEKDRYDIRIPSDIYEANTDATPKAKSYVPETAYSLRAYCSVLYLKPRMQVIIRGQKVKMQLIRKSLSSTRKDCYKPTFLNKAIPIIFGYNPKSKDQYGIMMYHKNRLIKAYERVGCQLKANNQGVGVIGIIECDFLDPTHNKQDFNMTDTYRKTMNSVETKLEDYCKEIHYRWSKENPNSTTAVEDTMKRPDQNWVQCDDCLKWRKLPDGIDIGKLPDKWYCCENPDPQFRSCQVEQELEDSDDDQHPYRKTYKQQEREKKKQQKKRKIDEEEQKHQREKHPAIQNECLKRRQQDPELELRQNTLQSPHTPTTPRSRLRSESLQGGAAGAESSPLRSSSISQAACSPSSNSGLPVISSVYSLTPRHVSGKRTQPSTPQSTPKRPRVSIVHRNIADTPSSADVSQLRLLDDTDSDTDDDIVILESASTPKPQKPNFDVTKVKKEQEPSDANDSILLECSDDAAVDDASAGTRSTESAAAGASPSPAPAPEITDTTTQTEAPTVKMEVESQNEKEELRTAEMSTSYMNGNEQSAHAADDVCGAEQRVIKQESEGGGDAQSDNAEKHILQREEKPQVKSDEVAGPSHPDASTVQNSPLHLPSFIEVQEQQDRLMELLQSTAQERDSFKERVDELNIQLQDMQNRLQELCQRTDRECSHQASQMEETEETQGGVDYKTLFEKANQKVDELIQDKKALLAAAEAKCNNRQNEERDMDEVFQQVDSLMREIDQQQKENDDLRSQLESLTEEKTNLAAQCEELRLSLQQQQQQKEEVQEGATDCSAQPDTEEAERTSGSGTNSDTFRSLISLRQNIGRLLITRVPALDLGQVNYECNVIDEILEQFLSSAEFCGAQDEIDEACN